MKSLVHRLVAANKLATPAELARLISRVAIAPFATDFLEVDEALWGGFWQFDVIAPGYILPASELAVLRAIRLDGNWSPDTSLAQYLADLRRAVRDPRAGVWALSVAGQPCLVIAAPDAPPLATAVWYCAATGQLHAGYRVSLAALHLPPGAAQQRWPQPAPAVAAPPGPSPEWLTQAVAQLEHNPPASLPAQLDAALLRLRLAGFEPAEG